ncbi:MULTISPECIES: S9 family peptidase [Pseudonocardia]|uniref:Prolyl tripeptidyl peptidase n=2 Tax=Pseudonocardia TaxID=1847 RepID=A0A1Y2N1U9_PSEAH|nr:MULTISPECIES: prolyl oligopeptidase family serine peptidase [Pseudonocardia]OSY41446.1 Prolyl tripeptidyl peptidase precursor [Pseudonocardia autotrophica]TDN71403.1 dipeptidyl aminopeptidase/acylaminoacyl peptidase [Pseudonocardia autotrophica]BBG02079.1 putative peptidase [Pseudonocardia autotrophica]GEC24093.1 putative peptidase [Pseudonocardia saturnea]
MTDTRSHPAPLIDLEDFFADPEFAVPTISPDGTRIAYLAPAYGRRNVWVRGIDETHDDAVCVTNDARRGITTYHWTDDPRWLLYLQDTDGNEDWHLHRVDLDAPDEPAVDLTPLAPGSRVAGVDPLPSVPGSVLVTMNERPLNFDTFRIDVATGTTTLLHEQDDPTATLLLDNEGEPVFHTALAADGTLEVSAWDAGTGRKRLLHRMGGAEHPMSIQPQLVTADGKGLLVGSYQDSDDLRLVRIDRETGAESVVAAVPGQSLDFTGMMLPGVLPPPVYTSRRTGEVLAARFVGDRPHIEIVDPRFAEVYAALEKLSDGVLGTLSSDESGQRWVATFGHDREPGVTWFYDHATGESRELFRPHSHLPPAALAPMTPVSFPARDGLPLHAFLTLPVGIEPRGLPLVLHVHGGPWAHDSWGFDSTAQFLANRGHAVLQVNFRGSSGYGRRHITAAIGEFAGAMHDDLIDAVDWAVGQGYADPDRIGIYGGSYGGYAALVATTVTPDRFAAAVDYVGISDLANFMRTLPPFTRAFTVNNWLRYVGDPDDPDAEADMLARSPITMVDRIRTPLLVAQGANDARVVQAESDNIVASLRERGVPVEYLLAEDEGHGFENPENRLRLYRAIERHFAEHLGGRSADRTA